MVLQWLPIKWFRSEIGNSPNKLCRIKNAQHLQQMRGEIRIVAWAFFGQSKYMIQNNNILIIDLNLTSQYENEDVKCCLHNLVSDEILISSSSNNGKSSIVMEILVNSEKKKLKKNKTKWNNKVQRGRVRSTNTMQHSERLIVTRVTCDRTLQVSRQPSAEAHKMHKILYQRNSP